MGCGCQTYLKDVDNPEKCFYCKHYIAFHFDFTNETSNYRICQKDFTHCGCQVFVPNSEDGLKCKYCDHYNAFYKPGEGRGGIFKLLNLLSQISTSLSVTITSREEV